MRLSVLSSSFVAAIVGFGGSVAIVIGAARAVDATQSETSSWIAVLCLAMMLSSAALSYTQRIPIITAWSTPGAALIATTSGLTLGQAATAFILCGFLTLLTAAIPIFEKAIQKIPASVAAGVLAGVLFPFVQAVVTGVTSNPWLAGGMVATFLILRPLSPNWSIIGVLVCGLAISFLSANSIDRPSLQLALPKLIVVEWDWSAAVGLGLPLFLVTMASQNLPGLAVLRAAGYSPNTRPIFAGTGILTVINGFFGAHSIGLAAITASICVGKEAHPDALKRWTVGISYALLYGALALFSPTLVSFFDALPTEFIVILAGLALIGPMMYALQTALSDEAYRFPGMVAFFVTASGVSFAQIGAAFWGLAASLAVIATTVLIQHMTNLKTTATIQPKTVRNSG